MPNKPQIIVMLDPALYAKLVRQLKTLERSNTHILYRKPINELSKEEHAVYTRWLNLVNQISALIPRRAREIRRGFGEGRLW